jgi:L-2-hydroxyglutarate oxidase LhgO
MPPVIRKYDVLVIGGGVVGLWTAFLAAKTGAAVAILERNDTLGRGVATRNSGVLHSGLYYEAGSLKAEHCIRGRHMAVPFLQEQGVPFALCGKYIVPTVAERGAAEHDSNSTDEAALQRLQERANINGVEEVEIVSVDRACLPFLRATRALRVGCTGIVDLPAYVAALEQAARKAGAEIFPNRQCVAAEGGSGSACRILTRRTPLGTDADHPGPQSDPGLGEEEFTADRVVNAAGLYADAVARMFGLVGFEVRPNKGSYFRLRFPLPGQTLVYPLPSHHMGFLGIHYTPDLRGNAWAGPDTSPAAEKWDFMPTADRAAFHDGLSRIVSGYAPDDLIGPEKAGLRARLFENNVPRTDFVLREQPGGVFHLLGIESPGLTSAPSLAREVLTRLGVL